MSHHTFISNRVHIVFGSKDRRSMIPDIQLRRLWAYISGIIRNLGAKAYAVGGTKDHVHIFLGLPATMNLAEIVQKIKANSSRWMHEDAGVKLFSWQEGYAAFSVSMSHSDATIAYIDQQTEHHKKRDFSGEMEALLEKLDLRAVPGGTLQLIDGR